MTVKKARAWTIFVARKFLKKRDHWCGAATFKCGLTASLIALHLTAVELGDNLKGKFNNIASAGK